MGCTTSHCDNVPVVNLDKPLIQYARKTMRPSERFNPNYKLDPQWSFVDHTRTSIEYDIESNPLKTSKCKVCLFETEFTNDTGSDQTYSFKAERQTKSVVRATVQKGFTIGGQLKCGLDVSMLAGHLNATYNLTTTKENTFEDNLNWSVDSSVKVKEHEKTKASLNIQEEKKSATYTLTDLFTPRGMYVPVYVVHKKTGDIVRAINIPAEKFVAIVSRVAPDAEKVGEGVQVISKGVCDVSYGSKQIIKIQPNDGEEQEEEEAESEEENEEKKDFEKESKEQKKLNDLNELDLLEEMKDVAKQALLDK